MQMREREAEELIDSNLNHFITRESIIIPTNPQNIIKLNMRFKLISKKIKAA